MEEYKWIVRVVLVIALLLASAALSTPRGRLPLALRGLKKILHRDAGEKVKIDEEIKPSLLRRIISFLLILIATAISLKMI